MSHELNLTSYKAYSDNGVMFHECCLLCCASYGYTIQMKLNHQNAFTILLHNHKHLLRYVESHCTP